MMFKFAVFAVLMVGFALVADPALASTTPGGGGGLPWERGIMVVSNSISGPVAYGALLLGLVAGTIALIFGGEMQDFVRRVLYFVMVGALLVGATGIIPQLFTGAVIPDDVVIVVEGEQ